MSVKRVNEYNIGGLNLLQTPKVWDGRGIKALATHLSYN